MSLSFTGVLTVSFIRCESGVIVSNGRLLPVAPGFEANRCVGRVRPDRTDPTAGSNNSTRAPARCQPTTVSDSGSTVPFTVIPNGGSAPTGFSP